ALGANTFAPEADVDERFFVVLDAARNGRYYLGPFDPQKQIDTIKLSPVAEGAGSAEISSVLF
ncbi:MAG: hypothetical protein AAFR59_19455, partial [Bacteroidota bacterium]